MIHYSRLSLNELASDSIDMLADVRNRLPGLAGQENTTMAKGAGVQPAVAGRDRDDRVDVSSHRELVRGEQEPR